QNNKLPNDILTPTAPVTIGRVTVAEGYGPGQNIATYFVLMGTPPSNPLTQGGPAVLGQLPVVGGTVDYGHQMGLLRTPDDGKAFTKVTLSTNAGGIDAANPPNFVDIDLLGNDASNVGSLVIDPTDANVVYVGGADNSEPNTNPTGTAPPSFGLVRVDT